MESYYYIPKDAYTFELQADICEEVLKDDDYIIKDYPLKRKIDSGIVFRIKRLFRLYFGASPLCSFLSRTVLKNTKFADTVRLNREDHCLVKINVPSKKQLRMIENDINKMLESRISRN